VRKKEKPCDVAKSQGLRLNASIAVSRFSCLVPELAETVN